MEHNGVTITIDERTGKFSAFVNGETIETTSLAGMKKKLDGANAFEQFSALIEGRWGNAYKPVTVVGIKKPRANASWRDEPEWKLSDGDTTRTVYADTPENRAALDARKELFGRQNKEREEMRERHEKERHEADAKVVTKEPS